MFRRIGFYPDCPGQPMYTLTSPVFDRVEIKLDPKYYANDKLVIEVNKESDSSIYINNMILDGKKVNNYRISHDALVHGKKIVFELTDKAKK